MLETRIEVLESIRSFAGNKSVTDFLKLPMLPIAEVVEMMKQSGFEKSEELETNGWQVDFWFSFFKEDTTIVLSGSLYYGGYKLTKTTD